MIAAIALRPRTPSSLAAEIGLSRPATTRQLHLLEEAGLIRATRSMADRRGMVLTMDPRTHGQITAWLAGTDIGRRLKPLSGAFESIPEPQVVGPIPAGPKLLIDATDRPHIDATDRPLIDATDRPHIDATDPGADCSL